jgi:hypothetical protein
MVPGICENVLLYLRMVPGIRENVLLYLRMVPGIRENVLLYLRMVLGMRPQSIYTNRGRKKGQITRHTCGQPIQLFHRWRQTAIQQIFTNYLLKDSPHSNPAPEKIEIQIAY